jgi:hypothetical protein
LLVVVSSAVVTETIDARLTSSFKLSGGTRSVIASSLIAKIVPRKPPLVVTVFQRLQHGLPFFLASLLRHDQEKVEDRKDKNERGDAQPSHTARRL